MSANELKRIVRDRIADTLGISYAKSPDASALIDAVAWALSKGGLVILDSKRQIVYFRNEPTAKFSNKKPLN